MKKLTFIAVLLIVAAGFTFAEGAQESPVNEKTGRNSDERPAFGDMEELTVTGILDLSGFGPRLKADEEVYVLMVPRFLPEGIEVTDGQEITVTGYSHVVPAGYGRGYVTKDDVAVISVTKAVIDGEEYDIPRGSGSRGFARGGYGDYSCCDDDYGRGRGGRMQGGGFGGRRPMPRR